MAVIKAVSSRAKIGTALDYVTRDEKTDAKLLSGLNCQPETVKDEMQATKELWGKTDGRTYKHFVQSFAPGENVTPEKAHEIACRLAADRPEWKGFEVLIATHKDRDHIHTHFIVNSVSFVDGHKLQQSKADLQNMKDCSDRLCAEYGLSITEKGKTFSGEEREETSAYSKETYQFLKKAEREEVKSYVQDIALAVMDCREQATSRQHFVELMTERGIKTDWQDNRKYITFTDTAREQAGETKCKIRNNKLEKYYNIDFGKEELERGFEVNARCQETADRAREQLDRTSGTAKQENNGAGNKAAGDLLRELNAAERAAEKERQNREAVRIRQSAAAQLVAAERERAAAESRRRSRNRGRGEDQER